MALADVQTMVDQLARVEASLVSTQQRDAAIGIATGEYSKDRPRERVADAAMLASGQVRYLPLPADWTAVSRILEVEWPVDREPPQLLDASSLRIEVTQSGMRIRFASPPAAGEAVRLRYTTRHTLDGTADTIPVEDRYAVSALAASILLDQVAAKMAAAGESSLGAVVGDRQSLSGEYARRARDLRERYAERIRDTGGGGGAAHAAAVIIDWSIKPSHGKGLLTH